MLITMLKSKIHRATVTSSSVDYEGSLTIDKEWMDKVGLLPYEKILCSNINNGARFETYAIAGEPGSRVIVLNGAAARLGKVGDKLTIMSFARTTIEEGQSTKPKIIVLGEDNRVVTERGI
jgi:aspartate 1-decarboxylase